MSWNIKGFLIFFVFLSFSLCGQNVQILDVNQIFAPSISFGLEQTLPQKIVGSSEGWFSNSQFSASALVPVAGDIGLRVAVDIDKPADLLDLRKTIRPKGYQILLNGGLQYVRPRFGKYTQQANIMQVNAGALALHYKGLGAMFYAANVGFSEDVNFTGKTQIRYSALLGYLKLVSLRKQIFYGAFIAPVNNFPVPIPFFGMNKKISRNLRFTMILPAQVGVVYKHNRKLKQFFDVGLNSLIGGIPNLDGRLLKPLSNSSLQGRLDFGKVELRLRSCVQYKTNRNIILTAQAGINSGSLMWVSQGNFQRTEYLSPTLFANVSVNYLFTESLVTNLFKELLEW